MSLSDRLAEEQPSASNRGCHTCKWMTTLSSEDLKSLDEWVASGWSVQHLYRICASDPHNPVKISMSAFRNHFRDCNRDNK